MGWIYKATGNMTLSVIDEDQFQILKVDVLACNTLLAGKDGEILMHTYNDLFIIAGFSEVRYQISIDNDLPYPEAGISPTPWALSYNDENRALLIKSGKRTIADRPFPKSFSELRVNEIINVVNHGIKLMVLEK